MKYTIRKYLDSDINQIIELSVIAWEDVFASFRNNLGSEIYSILYPDWRKIQEEGILGICTDTEKYHTLVAEKDKKVVGFLSFRLIKEEEKGEVVLLAVHPEYQNDGIGTELNLRALQLIKESGMKMAVVETGGDDSHAPARRSYEKAGYTGLPLVRYFKDL